jgi:hypothetical protein
LEERGRRCGSNSLGTIDYEIYIPIEWPLADPARAFTLTHGFLPCLPHTARTVSFIIKRGTGTIGAISSGFCFFRRAKGRVVAEKVFPYP